MSPAHKPPAAGKSPFGQLLTSLRTQRGMTQERLAAATDGDRMSPRSITNYERAAANMRRWVLPHRPALRSLADAMKLDPSERRALTDAWSETKALKESSTPIESSPSYVPQGRESIVEQIMAAWEVVKSGQPRIVLLGGDSGIGKSTLARHICDLIAASTPQVMVTWGEAHSWTAPVEPYFSMRHATDRMLVPPPPSFTLPGLYPSRPALPDELLQRVVHAIPQLGGVLISETTIRELADGHEAIRSSALGSIMELRAASESFGRWDEYVNLITCMTQAWPIVMVLEDIHWASDLTISLLQHLAHHLSKRRDVPLLIVGTYRSNELWQREDDSPHPLARFLETTANLDSVRRIPMGETLSPVQGTSFIRGLVSTLPMVNQADEEALVEWLYPRTSGQPMLTVELIRHLRQGGGLVRIHRASAWRFEPDAVPAGVSPAISTLFAQRIAPIDYRGKVMLAVAAAMGDTIIPEIMADVMQMDEEALLDQIDTVLVQRHELLLPGEAISLGQRSYSRYRFPHALLREHIHQEIQPIRRRRIHLDIAEAMARAFTDTDSVAMGEITQHYVMAEEWHRAEMAAYRMAQLKASRLDWELATVWFDHAEQLAKRAQDPQQLWRTRAARMVVMRGLYQTAEAISLGQRIIYQAQMHDWTQTLALAHHHLAEIYYDLGELDKTVEHINIANEIHEREHTLDLASAGQAMLSHATYRQGKYDIARHHAQRALAFSREIENGWVRSEALLAAANCDVDIGFYHEALDNYRAAIELAAMNGKLSNQFLPALNIGLCLTMMGDYDAAIEELTQTIERMRPHRVPRMIAWGQLYLGFALEESGDLEAALAAFHESTAARRQHDNPPVLSDSIAGLISVYTRLEDKAAVAPLLDELVERVDGMGLYGVEDSALVLLSMARGFRLLGNEAEYWRRLEHAHTLVMGRAADINDPVARTSYLTNVPTTAEIQRRFGERSNA